MFNPSFKAINLVNKLAIQKVHQVHYVNIVDEFFATAHLRKTIDFQKMFLARIEGGDYTFSYISGQ